MRETLLKLSTRRNLTADEYEKWSDSKLASAVLLSVARQIMQNNSKSKFKKVEIYVCRKSKFFNKINMRFRGKKYGTTHAACSQHCHFAFISGLANCCYNCLMFLLSPLHICFGILLLFLSVCCHILFMFLLFLMVHRNKVWRLGCSCQISMLKFVAA